MAIERDKINLNGVNSVIKVREELKMWLLWDHEQIKEAYIYRRQHKTSGLFTEDQWG